MILGQFPCFFGIFHIKPFDRPIFLNYPENLHRDHKLHGFYHARKAMENAQRDFGLNPLEANIIHRHMFPLNPTPPKYKESVVVTCADKICATREVWSCVRNASTRRFRALMGTK